MVWLALCHHNQERIIYDVFEMFIQPHLHTMEMCVCFLVMYGYGKAEMSGKCREIHFEWTSFVYSIDLPSRYREIYARLWALRRRIECKWKASYCLYIKCEWTINVKWMQKAETWDDQHNLMWRNGEISWKWYFVVENPVEMWRTCSLCSESAPWFSIRSIEREWSEKKERKKERWRGERRVLNIKE